MSVKTLGQQKPSFAHGRTRLASAVVFMLLVLCFAILSPGLVSAQDLAQIKKGVVKITAQVEGKTKVGTGVVVRIEKEAAYIVTAAHVVEGDPKPTITFFTNQQQPFVGQVVGIEGGDQQGLAALRVAGPIPDSVVALPLDLTTKVAGARRSPSSAFRAHCLLGRSR